MSKKTLTNTNPYLCNAGTARKMRVRSLASSTAIETRESIATIEAKIEAKLTQKRPARHPVTLA